MEPRILVLGAGFGGLELSSILSDGLGERLDLTLIDRSDSFVFGYSKLDVMFGHEKPDSVRVAYRHIVKPGVTFRQETITAIDPELGASRQTPERMRLMFWSSPSARTTTSTRHRGSRKAATNSTLSAAPSACAR